MSALSGAAKRIALLYCCLVATGVFGYGFNHTCTHTHTHTNVDAKKISTHLLNMNKSFAVFQSSFCHSKSLIHNNDGCQKGSVYCYQVRNLCMSTTLQSAGPLICTNIYSFKDNYSFSFSYSCHVQYINLS